MTATQAAEDRIMGTILRRLSQASADVQKAVVQAHVTGKPVPALDRKIARLAAVMRQAASQAVKRTEGLDRADVKPALDWRLDKLRALAKVIKMKGDSPGLGMLVAMSQQAAKFGSDLTGKVSDTLVAQHTADQEAACGPNQVLIWEPERDACVRCLKYAGQYRSADGSFIAGQSFDPRAPRSEGTLPGPPAHNRCRCQLAVIPKPAAADNSAALQREAQRSVLKGWALESESDAVRSRAAQALLNANPMAPKSVIAETRKRLKSGEPFIRDVP
jgi:hypothetical protein